jgi:hypothetical protein
MTLKAAIRPWIYAWLPVKARTWLRQNLVVAIWIALVIINYYRLGL